MRLSFTAVVAAGIALQAGLAGSAFADAATEMEGVDGIILSMEAVARATTYPVVSGDLAEGITLTGTPVLVNQRGYPLNVESEGTYYSDYKKSFYAPNMLLQDPNTFWTWSISFTVSQDISLDKTQVAFFSCNKSAASKTSCPYDYEIYYTLSLAENGDILSSADGSVVLAGTEDEASTARYDMAAGSILEGSGGMATSAWAEPVALLAGHTYTYSMKVSGETLSGTYNVGVGFGALRFIPTVAKGQNAQNIPEPAPSVLALTALAAIFRRRRCNS